MSMRFIESVFEVLRRHPKRIVFPEGAEPRVLRAAHEYARLGLGAPILLGPRDTVQAAANDLGLGDLQLVGIGVVDPATSHELPRFCEQLEKLERYKHYGFSDARALMTQPTYFGAMMLQYGLADALVGGATESPAAGVLRPLLQLLKPVTATGAAGEKRTVFGCTVAELPDRPYGDDGVLFLADCAVIP
ncbi:MAG: phosphate acetyltransferase, partial [Verrucomicrobia bacterium]|nr:phosphate acetyltransferase [Verrucomicrobiota bacterium]